MTDLSAPVSEPSFPPEADHDVVIVGGGAIGASLARGLAGAGVTVALVEAVPSERDAHPSYDDRAIALSLASKQILDGLGVWQCLAPRPAPIRQVHVSDRGHFGLTRLCAAEHGLEAFGYVSDAKALGLALTRSLEAQPVRSLCPAEVEAVSIGSDRARVTVRAHESQQVLRARLLVAADGGRSLVRRLLDIETAERAYGQCALIANVTTERDHGATAFERFTSTGPIALLPMPDDRMGLIWTVREEDSERLLALDDEAFLDALGAGFGTRLGRFLRVGRRSAYPLALIQAREQVRERLVVIGNAAHTLHPIAGQGMNLGLRDVAALAQVIVDARREGDDPGRLGRLRAYRRWRRHDHRDVTRFTDGLVWLFSNRLPGVTAARNLGLLAIDCVPGVKGRFVRRAMGLAGRQTRLARGLPL